MRIQKQGVGKLTSQESVGIKKTETKDEKDSLYKICLIKPLIWFILEQKKR